MKKLLLALAIACMAGWSSAAIVATWDGDQGGSATTPGWQDASLVSATLGPREVSSHKWTNKGSTDETFGTIGTPAATNNTFSWQLKDAQYQTFSVTNVSASDLTLNSIHFDYAHIFGALNVKLTYDSGDLADADATLVGERNTTGSVAALSDWEDGDVDLSQALTDRTLAPGQSATFRFDFDITGTGASGLDNIAIDAGDNPTYIETEVATPVISPDGGTNLNSVMVSLESTTIGAALYYTTNGIDPTTGSMLYTAPFTLTHDATVKVIGTKSGLTSSGVVSADFVVEIETVVATPTISPNGGTHTDSVEVTLETTTAGASLYYTTNGIDPTTGSTLYTAPFTLTADTTVKVIGTKTGLTSSAVVSAAFVVEIVTEVAAPTISPDGGTYVNSVMVTLETTTAGASLYYTTNGIDPTTGSTLYTAPFALTADTTVKVIGTKAGLTSSAVVSASFVIGAAPPSDIVAYWDGDQGFNAAGDPPGWQNTNLVSATLGAKGVSSHSWSGKGSTDTTFGTVGNPAAPNNTVGWQIKNGEFQTFEVTNVSGADLELNSIHFDYAHVFGALTVNLSYASGDLTDADGTSMGSYVTTGSVPSLGDWEDADVELSGFLTDRILAAGESAIFRFDFVGGVGGIDNLAIGAEDAGGSPPLLPPTLLISLIGGNVELSWSSSGAFKVQNKDSLTAEVWTDVPGATNSPIVLPATNPAAFFQLIEQ